MISCDNGLKVTLEPEQPCTGVENCPQIESYHPQTAVAGDVITFKGKRFNRYMKLMANDSEVKPTLTTRKEGSLVVPEGVAGVVDIKVKVFDTVVDGGAFIRLVDDHPVFTGDMSLICIGTKFYDSQGVLQEGKKSCTQHPSCQADGQTDCVANNNYKAADMALAVPEKIPAGHAIAGVQGIHETTYSLPSNLVPSNIKAGVTISGVAGGLIPEGHSNCSADGTTGCVAVPTFKAVDASVLVATNIKAGVTIAGIAGSLIPEVHSDCSTDGAIGCVAVAAFKAADMSVVVAGSIKRGVTIGGITGTYPSAATPLLRYSDDGNTTNTLGSDITDFTLFNTQMTSAGSFEFWDSTGMRYTGSGDADIINANVATGTSFENLSITGSSTTFTQCTSTLQGTCESDSACRWVGAACEINPWNIRAGVTIANKIGTAKLNCRNRVNSSIYNASYLPPTGATTADASPDWWDTIDNHNGNGSSTLPGELPAGWSTDNQCGKELWSDLTQDGSCDSAGDDCMIRDNVSNLIWSESHPAIGQAAAGTVENWTTAIQLCNDLSYGGKSDWRMPTQMELIDAYNHGILEVGFKGAGQTRPLGDSLRNNDYFISGTDQYYWSASHISNGLSSAHVVALYLGTVSDSSKGAMGFNRVICVTE